VLLNGARGQHKRFGDGRVGFALGHAGQYVALAGREISERRVCGTRALPDQRLDHLRVDDRPTLRDLPDSGEQLIRVGDALL